MRTFASLRTIEIVSGLAIQLHELRQPVIAAVNGPAAGGVLALALAADIRLCAPSAKFNAAFVRIGTTGCDMGTSYLLPRAVGSSLATEMLLTGRMVEADEALRHGLVRRIVKDEELLDEAIALARTIVRNAPLAVELTKRTMQANASASRSACRPGQPRTATSAQPSTS